MLKRMIKKLSNKKLLTILGFGAAVCMGMYVAGLVSAAITSYYGLGWISTFLIKIPLLFSGAALAAGLYTQQLKQFCLWPMENQGTVVSWELKSLYKDTIFVLKEFDGEFLKLFGQFLISFILDKVPALKDLLKVEKPPLGELEELEIAPIFNISFNLGQFFKKGMNAVVDIVAVPYLAKLVVSGSIHMFCFSLRNFQKLYAASNEERETSLKAEAVQFKGAFLINYPNLLGKGFFETAGSTLQDEYCEYRESKKRAMEV